MRRQHIDKYVQNIIHDGTDENRVVVNGTMFVWVYVSDEVEPN